MPFTVIAKMQGRLARALAARMSELGLSLRQIAQRTGLTYEHIRKLTKGEAYPSKLALQELCRALDLDLREMETLAVADRVENKYGGIPHALAGNHPELSLLAPSWDLLTSEQKESFRVQIRSVAEANQLVAPRKPVKSVTAPAPMVPLKKRR